MNAIALRLAVIVSILLVSAGFAYHHGVSVTDAKWEARYNQEMATAYERVAAAEAAARDVERKSAERISAIEKEHDEENQRAQEVYDRLVDDYRAGAVRLRDRLTCSAPASNVPNPASSPSHREPQTVGGLQPEDVQFLVSEAKRADEVVRQLHACQSILGVERIRDPPTRPPP